LNFFFLKNRNQFKPTGFGSVRFFRIKTGLNYFGLVFSILARFFPVLAWFWLGFSILARFFSGFFLGSVRFGFFSFFKIIEPNRTGWFFKILISLINFFYGSIFSKKFSNFLTLIDFLDFLLLLPGRIYNYHDNYDNNINWLMGKYPDTVGHMSTSN